MQICEPRVGTPLLAWLKEAFICKAITLFPNQCERGPLVSMDAEITSWLLAWAMLFSG